MRDGNSISVLVTAGGTREDIDAVRSITNHATGRLGSLIAGEFSRRGAKVDYLCGETSLAPKPGDCGVIRIRSAAQLEKAMDALLRKKPYDAVIHSMAVSDFTPHRARSVDEIVNDAAESLYGERLSKDEISSRIRDIILNGGERAANEKISSKHPYLALVLRQTPKIITGIKEIQPQTLLVGFKLLSGVSEDALLEAALESIALNKCDYVLANDLNEITEKTHKAILLDKNGITGRAGTKPEIARMIFKAVRERLDKNR